MRRVAVARTLGLVLAYATTVCAQQSAPSLTPPASTPPVAETPAPLPPPAELPVLEAEPLPSTGPMLAVPGLAVPGGNPYRTLRVPTPPGPVGRATDLPPLVGPVEGLGPATSQPTWTGSGNLGVPEEGGMRPMRDAMLPNGSVRANPNVPNDLDTSRRGILPPPSSAPRRPRLLGRLQPPPLLRSRGTPSADDTIAVEPRSDPATDAALKRRIESQVRAATDNHLRSLDVKVVDRDITIHARVNRFWYRRTVKHAIESLPGLAGYKTHIDVVN